MRVHKSPVAKLRHTLAAGFVVLLATAAVRTEAAQPASGFAPTMADYLAVYTALQNYRFGVEKHDEKALAKAFWKDGKNIAVPSPGMEINMPLDGSPPTGGPPPPAGAGRPGPNGGPPPGFTPPPGFVS